MSNNKSGYYLRSRTVPKNPQTSLQTAIRSSLAALSANWQSLTSAQQASWNLYAKNVTVVTVTGQQKILTGFNWYVACNQLRAQCGNGYIVDAPTVFTLASAPAIGALGYVDNTETFFEATVIDPPASEGTGDEIMVFIGRPVTNGQLYFKGPWQFVGCYDTYLAPTGIVEDLSGLTPYISAGTQNQWMRFVRTLPDGRYSTPVIKGPFNAFNDATADYGFISNPIELDGPHATPSFSASDCANGSIEFATMAAPVAGFSVGFDSNTISLIYNGSLTSGTYNGSIVGKGSLGNFAVPWSSTLS